MCTQQRKGLITNVMRMQMAIEGGLGGGKCVFGVCECSFSWYYHLSTPPDFSNPEQIQPGVALHICIALAMAIAISFEWRMIIYFFAFPSRIWSRLCLESFVLWGLSVVETCNSVK